MILVRRSASVRLAQPSDFGCTNRGQGAWEGPGISHAGSQDPNGHPGPLASVWTRTQCDSWCPGSSATCRLQKSLDGAADSVKWTFVKPEGRTASCLSPTPEGRVPVAGQRAVLAAPPNKRSPGRSLSLSARFSCLSGKHQTSSLPRTFVRTWPGAMSKADPATPS